MAAECIPGPRVSVVVPTYNRAGLLARTLPTLLDQDFDQRYEVVVVVDGSTDGTAEYLRSTFGERIRIVQQANQGPGAARNSGVDASAGELVLFIDDDALCDPAMVRTHWEEHRRHPGSVVFGPVRVSQWSVRSLATAQWARWTEAYLRRMDAGEPVRFPDDIWICTNTSLLRSDFIAAGGFDPALSTHEDTELALRLWKRGAVFRYAPAARADYLYVKSAYDLVGDCRSYGETTVALCRRHPEYLPVSGLPALASASGWRAVRGWLVVDAALDLSVPLQWLAALADRAGRHHGASAAARLLGMAVHAAILRRAGRAAGGWRQFRTEFGRSIAPS